MRLLQILKDKIDIILCVHAGDIERGRVRGDFGITYDDATLTTLYRYFEDWKRTGGRHSYSVVRKVMKNNPDFREQLIQGLAKKLEMPVDEVIKRMQRPWGLNQALRGQLPDYGLEREQSDVEARLKGALGFMRAAELFRNSPKELAELLQQIIMLKEKTRLTYPTGGQRSGRHG